MEEHSFELIDQSGVLAVARPLPQDPSSLEVRLPGGERLFVASALVKQHGEGRYAFDDRFEACLQRVLGGQVTVPVFEEQLEIDKRSVELERMKLVTSVSTHEQRVDVPLWREALSVERVPVGRVVERATGPRQEGDTLIVPVYEEQLFVEKRLVLKEEVRVTRTRREDHESRDVKLRREEIRVERSANGREP